MSKFDDNGDSRSNATIIYVLFILIVVLLIALIFCIAIINADPALVESINKDDKLDVIKIAIALGRLDAITVLMMLVTVAVGLSGIFGYREIRKNAETKAIAESKRIASKIAKKEAHKIAREEARSIASDEVRKVYGNVKFAQHTQEINDLMESITEGESIKSNIEITVDKFSTSENIMPMNSEKDC